MKCKVLAHKLGYKGTTYAAGDTVEMSDTDPCTKVLIKIGRVAPIKASKKAEKKAGKKAGKKASKKASKTGVSDTYENRALKSK